MRKQGIRTYLKDDAEKINNRYKQLYFRVKNNKYIKELDKKYRVLRIVDTYTFLVMNNYFKLTKNDIKNFEICISILIQELITNKQKNRARMIEIMKELGIYFE